MENKLKMCLDCKENKSLIEFVKNKARNDGLEIYCKSCNKLRRDNYKYSCKEIKTLKNIPEINKWLQDNYEQLIINCKKTCGSGYKYWGEDLLPFIIEEFLYKPEEYQMKVFNDGKMENWITKAMSFQLKLSSSPFYHKYRKDLINERSTGLENMEYETDSYNEEIITKLHELINKMDDENRQICTDLFINGKEIKETREKFNINQHAMVKKVKQYKKYFYSQLKQYV